MKMDKNVITITSFNCNGLGQKPKRINIFKWLKKEYQGIICLQETYSVPKIEKKWTKEMGHQYKLYFSHGTSNSRGVCTIVPKPLAKFITNTYYDKDGRSVALQFHLGGKNYTIVNNYAPTQDNVKEQLEFFKTMEKTMDQFHDTTFIMGGDFNTIQNPALDKYKPKNHEPSKNAKYFNSIAQERHLGDIWRVHNPTKRR